MSKKDTPETDKKKAIPNGTANDHGIKVAEDYLKHKQNKTLNLDDFDNLLKECGIDKETL